MKISEVQKFIMDRLTADETIGASHTAKGSQNRPCDNENVPSLRTFYRTLMPFKP